MIEAAIPVEVPSRVLAALAGAADVHAVVIRNGVVLYAPGNLNLGRNSRLANRDQRRALRRLYRCCAIPGCSVDFDRCKLHHDGWPIALGPHRGLTVAMPDGTIRNTGPPTIRAA